MSEQRVRACRSEFEAAIALEKHTGLGYGYALYFYGEWMMNHGAHRSVGDLAAGRMSRIK